VIRIQCYNLAGELIHRMLMSGGCPVVVDVWSLGRDPVKGEVARVEFALVPDDLATSSDVNPG
jgi:hypothetical protein